MCGHDRWQWGGLRLCDSRGDVDGGVPAVEECAAERGRAELGERCVVRASGAEGGVGAGGALLW